MKLADLNPQWFAEPGRQGQGLNFNCPCPKCSAIPNGSPQQLRVLSVWFANPLDGQGSYLNAGWQRVGETFETLTITPSIDASKSGHWHGWIRDGEVTP